MREAIGFGFVAVVAIALAGCGGSSGGTAASTTSTSAADSLSDLPATSTLLSSGASSASLSAKSAGKAVTGTPPLLKDITSSTVDTYFWNGLLATLGSTAVESITEAQRQAFWQGEGACRMAQATGFAIQNLSQGGISMCYMQNAPLSANGVSITSGTATATSIFDQGASDKVIKVSMANEPDMGNSSVFIKVYGTGSSEGGNGYAADLWFCSASNVVGGYEQIRVVNSTGAVTTTSVHRDSGSFVGIITAFLTTNASGQFIFDTTKDRGAAVYFSPEDASMTFLGNVSADSTGRLTARDYWTGSFGGETNTNKHAVFATITGDTMKALRLLESSFALQDTFSGTSMTITDATEYSTTHYANVDSGTLLTTARAERFDSDLYSGTSSTAYSTAQSKLSAISGFSCSTTPDVTVSMDFSASGPLAVKTLCEPGFSNMNFCDGQAVSMIRGKVMQSQAVQGTCATSFCAFGDDFSCRMWADDHPSNAQGITTANAKCSATGCCTTQ